MILDFGSLLGRSYNRDLQRQKDIVAKLQVLQTESGSLFGVYFLNLIVDTDNNRLIVTDALFNKFFNGKAKTFHYYLFQVLWVIYFFHMSKFVPKQMVDVFEQSFRFYLLQQALEPQMNCQLPTIHHTKA